MMLAYGGAGTGKTHALKLAFDGVAKPLAMLAPSADASRDVLRRDFPDANTVAAIPDRHEMASSE